MTLTISQIRQRFIEYKQDPAKFLDLTSRYHEGDGCFRVYGKSLAELLEAEELGSGCMATVYDIGNNRVLKVCKQLDKGYDAYVEACRANPSNPHLPKVYYRGIWANHYIYVLEKLTHVGDYSRDFITQFVRSAAEYGKAEPDPMLNPDLFGPELIEACLMVKRLSESTQTRVDLHYRNMMLRGNTLVITDPLID